MTPERSYGLFRLIVLRSALLLASASILSASAVAARADVSYPTVTRVEYVLACLAANGDSRNNLFRCSCTIDYIAAD